MQSLFKNLKGNQIIIGSLLIVMGYLTANVFYPEYKEYQYKKATMKFFAPDAS